MTTLRAGCICTQNIGKLHRIARNAHCWEWNHEHNQVCKYHARIQWGFRRLSSITDCFNTARSLSLMTVYSPGVRYVTEAPSDVSILIGGLYSCEPLDETSASSSPIDMEVDEASAPQSTMQSYIDCVLPPGTGDGHQVSADRSILVAQKNRAFQTHHSLIPYAQC